MHKQSLIERRVSRKIYVGSVAVGGDAPISVQSMTNTNTCDVDATVAQILRLEAAGADIVRVSVPDMEAAEAFGRIKKQVHAPLVADIHFDHRIALRVAELGVDCLRINPGNIGSDAKVREVVACARHHNIPIRIGVNAGSLEKEIQRDIKKGSAIGGPHLPRHNPVQPIRHTVRQDQGQRQPKPPQPQRRQRQKPNCKARKRHLIGPHPKRHQAPCRRIQQSAQRR